MSVPADASFGAIMTPFNAVIEVNPITNGAIEMRAVFSIWSTTILTVFLVIMTMLEIWTNKKPEIKPVKKVDDKDKDKKPEDDKHRKSAFRLPE